MPSAPTPAAAPLLLKVGQVADQLQVHVNTVFTLIASGELESVKVRGARRVLPQSVAEYIARLRGEPEQAEADGSGDAAGGQVPYGSPGPRRGRGHRRIGDTSDGDTPDAA